jgi:hypothetical protein
MQLVVAIEFNGRAPQIFARSMPASSAAQPTFIGTREGANSIPLR